MKVTVDVLMEIVKDLTIKSDELKERIEKDGSSIERLIERAKLTGKAELIKELINILNQE